MTMPRGLLPVGISSTRVASLGSNCTAGAPVDGSTATLTTMLLAVLTTYPSLLSCLKAIAQGWVMKRRSVEVCCATARCMLIVRPASTACDRSITWSKLCVLTLNRTGPLGEAHELGTYANCHLMAILFS